MNRIARVPRVVVALAAAVLAAPLSAQDVPIAGEWDLAWQMETPRGTRAQVAIARFEVEGSSLTGTLTMSLPGRGEQGGMRDFDLHDGSVDGTEIEFSVTLGRGDRSVTQVFRATVRVDGMTGVVVTPRGEVSFTGSRRARSDR